MQIQNIRDGDAKETVRVHKKQKPGQPKPTGRIMNCGART
jgi:hypothetical protein